MSVGFTDLCPGLLNTACVCVHEICKTSHAAASSGQVLGVFREQVAVITQAAELKITAEEVNIP